MHVQAIAASVAALLLSNVVAGPLPIDDNNDANALTRREEEGFGPINFPNGNFNKYYKFRDGTYGEGFRADQNGFTFNHGDTQFGLSKFGYFIKKDGLNWDLTRNKDPYGNQFYDQSDEYLFSKNAQYDWQNCPAGLNPGLIPGC